MTKAQITKMLENVPDEALIFFSIPNEYIEDNQVLSISRINDEKVFLHNPELEPQTYIAIAEHDDDMYLAAWGEGVPEEVLEKTTQTPCFVFDLD